MINLLSKHPKINAAFLFGLFYADLAGAVSLKSMHAKNDPTFRRNSIANQTYFSTRQQNSADFDKPAGSFPTTNAAELPPEQQHTDVGGPNQPEMSSFQSVNSSNMVNLFTGDFSYNIPLMDVGGYPVNIHYSSGVSMDQEASWVGLGWNINPGTVNRTMRGLPDDFNGQDTITQVQNVKVNQTVGVKISPGMEATGVPLELKVPVGIFYNTYNGWGTEFGINASINSGQAAKGPLSGSLGISNNSQTGLDISPSLSVKLTGEKSKLEGFSTLSTNFNSRAGIAGLQLSTEVRRTETITRSKGEEGSETTSSYTRKRGGTHGAYISFATPSYIPRITMPLTNSQFAFSAKLGDEKWVVFSNISIEGYVSRQFIAAKDQIQQLPAYGYMHLSKPVAGGKVLLDFNREKDIPFNQKTTPHIAVPQYTYDVYSVSGEGTGGMFRPYRGDVGFVYDHAVKTNSTNSRISGDLGFGAVFHGGVDFSGTMANTESGPWLVQNDALRNIRFQKSDTTFQEVFFRNPGEKSINNSSFYEDLGGDSLIRVALDGSGNYIRSTSALTTFNHAKPVRTFNVNKVLAKRERDKRSQVITYLNATEASLFGLDKKIRSYRKDVNPVLNCTGAFDEIPRVQDTVRKSHHISQISVLNPDGRRYIYGLPVYNVDQQDVTFAVPKVQDAQLIDLGLVDHTRDEKNQPVGQNHPTRNTSGKDNYYSAERTPAYAHAFLLTGLLSPDYVDITQDGITEDDLGDAVKFNYTQFYGPQNGYYKWRTPGYTDRSNYDEGLKSYNRDDRGSYMFGKKEVWYLHSLESKTMIALFHTSNRLDAKSANTDYGTEVTKPLQQLDSIELFVKADLIKNGIKARPVKTAYFGYTYELCKNLPGQSQGKLTLKKIWFSYNGNKKGELNPYTFSYNGLNPDYHPKHYDRWGNYKDPSTNPGTTSKLSNTDFPYANQDKATADPAASAWHLTDLRLPSGGRMKVDYESDDYAYVQNKRATQMFTIAGFGKDESQLSSQLYDGSGDNNYVFVDVPAAVSTKEEVRVKYLEGIEKIYFKIAVQVPTDTWGGGYEFVPTYGVVRNYGVLDNNHNRIWIELDGSPLVRTALQFLRQNLPSKAYPNSEPGDNLSLGAIVRSIAIVAVEMKRLVEGFESYARKKGLCQNTIPAYSMIKLTNPEHRKLGGGNRVKSIRIYDNWQVMTKRSGSAGMKESVYGQSYQYTTTRNISGQEVEISSGVASYEPMIGSEENPLKSPIEYTEQATVLAPRDQAYTETPLGESFFPSASVGYSKVRVRTINAKAKSANGWEETEFYTTKDFPTIAEFTPLDASSKRTHNPVLQNFLRINAQRYVTLSQGFKVELNDMDGKMKANSSYAETDSIHPFRYTWNFYKMDANGKLDNNVWAVDSANGNINKSAIIGKEVEVMFDARQQRSNTFSGSFSTNLELIPGFPLIPVIPIPSGISLPQSEENRYRSIAVTKIVQKYGILDSVVVMDKGSIVSTKNVVYDGETGEVVLSRTNNEFNDFVYNFSYPAHWAYTGMGLAYQNVDAIFHEKKVTDGIVINQDRSHFPMRKFFESGDEILATGIRRSGIGSPAYGEDCPEDLYPPSPKVDTTRLWVIEGDKGVLKEKGQILIDDKGMPYSAKKVTLRILRSGKRNFTDLSVGSITSLASPIKLFPNGQSKISFDSSSKVINTAANTFKDLSPVENSFYQIDSCYTVIRTANSVEFPSDRDAANFRTLFLHKQSSPKKVYQPIPGRYSEYFTASSKKRHWEGNKHRDYRVKSILRFDLSSIPPGSTVTSANLVMNATAPTYLWADQVNDDLSSFLQKTRAHYLNGGNGALNGRTNAAIIQEVTGGWDLNVAYTNLKVSPTTYQVPASPDASCVNKTVSVTAIAQKHVNQPASNYGFLINLQAESTGETEDNSSERMQTFCAPILKQVYDLTPPGGILPGDQLPTDPNGCLSCSSPVKLVVSYTYQKDTCVKVCRANINDTAINPYRWGILGNWRLDKAITFYHDRAESEIANYSTNIRTDGQLKEFIPYWNFTDSTLSATTDTMKWVWNSAISLFNRKGFEIENFDALGRYNSGLYGYNATMPIAVAQNSRYREILFDGFEDYGYQAQYCNTACPNPRSYDFLKGNSNASIDATQKHTGKNSLKVNANTQASLLVPIGITDIIPPSLDVAIDSTPVYLTTVTGKGKGLRVTYSCIGTNTTPVSRYEGPINHMMDTIGILPACVGFPFLGYNTAEWNGKIQPKYTDNYFFYINSSYSGASISINGIINLAVTSGAGYREGVKIRLEAGKLYTIRVTLPLFLKRRQTTFSLGWRSDQYQPTEIIPLANLYGPFTTATDSVGSVRKDIKTYCINGDNVEPNHVLLPTISLIRGSNMIVGGWVKVGTDVCESTSAPSSPDPQLKVTFNSVGTSYLLEKTGMPIEGWQRYEAVFTLPTNTNVNMMTLTLKSSSAVPTFFDDMRIQPFLGHMKSFVYDPSNLRLMAELDENNYSTLYEYDDDGTLIRIKKETERGIKTIKETRSALSKSE